MDLNTLVPALPVPVFFLIGRFDTVTPPTVTRRYFDKLSAPQKEWIWFDHSAHTVVLDEPEKVGVVIRNGVRQIEEKYKRVSPRRKTSKAKKTIGAGGRRLALL